MDIITIFFLIISPLITFLFIVLTSKPNSQQHLNLPPGPPKLPLIGNLLQLAGSLPHRAFRNLAKNHGPIMHIQLAQISAIIISSPRLAKEVLKTHDLALASRPTSLASHILFYGNTNIAFTPYGDYWRQLRKICSLQLLSAKKVRSFAAIRQREFNSFVKSLGLLSDGEPIDVHEKVTEMVNNVICVSSFGDNCRQRRRLLEIVDRFGRELSGFYLADLFPDCEFLSVILGRKSNLLKVRESFDEILDEILEERRRRGSYSEFPSDEHEDGDLLEVLLRVKEDGGVGFAITNDNIKAIFADIFAAGTDTSSITIEWAMTEMIRNPSVMKKVQTEVREAFKWKTMITEKDLQSLSYMQLVIKETLRLHPPVPLLLPRECREQCKIDGYDIHVKQKVMINAWACATDPEYWEDAESFKPERFEKTSVDFMGNDYEFIPFGAGRRMCPGVNFGLRSVEFFLAHMLYFYDWNLPDGLNPTDVDMTETEGVFAGRKDHLRLIPTFYPKVVDDAPFINLNM
ncbi:hypothetical protein L1987_36967 [Smallanthus sonchifolius]|uniref:Uncharacterized protein n=1 Tax=Smallanthus sonchifolius TaxID=185202 RepID=A0ACB9HHL5_9ASTR|nr:hypothetical protein L1987_36967 [Smallanthus sonchifolius]